MKYLTSQNRMSDALLIAETAARLERGNKMFQNLVDQLKTAQKNCYAEKRACVLRCSRAKDGTAAA